MDGAGKEGRADTSATIFVSYSRADEKRARLIVNYLERAGYSVWWDGLLGGGERFSRAIAEALEHAQAVVVLWSRNSVDSTWVQDEAGHGRDLGQLIPLSIDGTQPPLGFRQFQSIDVTRARRDGPEMRRLLEAVAALHAAVPLQRTPRAAAAPPRAIGRRAWFAGAGAAVIAAGGLAAAWKAGLIGGPPAAKTNTVAVLPFANMSGDPKQGYFADGLCTEVRAALAHNAGLRVMGQVSSDVFRNHTEDAKSIARKLGVAFLLDGSVRQAPGRVRISAELIDAASGFSKWSETFDRSLDDIFAVQSEIADKVTAALTNEVAHAGARRIGGTDNVAAFDAYLRGKAAFALAAGPETDREALTRFEEAIAADPRFAAAHAARARTLVASANQYSQGSDRRALFDDAIAAAQLSVQLAPDLPEAQAALALALISGRLDLKAARGPSVRSYELGRGDAEVTARYAMYAAQVGRFPDAEAAIRRAQTLDPLNPRIFWNAGFIQYAGHHYPQARAAWGRALALNPKMTNAHGFIGHALVLEGQLAAAEGEYQLEKNASSRLPGLAIVARRRGDAAAAQRAFDQLVAERGDNALFQQGLVLAQWGEADRAVATLIRARAEGDPGLFMAGVEPLLDPLRKDARFSGLLRDIGFD